MRRIGIFLFVFSSSAAVAHLVWAFGFSGTTLLDVPLADAPTVAALPFDFRTTRDQRRHRVGPVELTPHGGPYRATLVLWGSGMRTEYAAGVVDADGRLVWSTSGARQKTDTPSRSSSVMGAFEVDRGGPHHFVVAFTERPGLAPSGASLELRGDVAEVEWRWIAACGVLAVVGVLLSGRRGAAA